MPCWRELVPPYWNCSTNISQIKPTCLSRCAAVNPKLVTIATFGDSIEANLAKHELQAAGVASVLLNENTASMWGLPALEAVKLQVDEQNAVMARKILDDTTPVEFPEPEVEVFEAFDNEPPPDEKPAEGLTSREQDADRALRSALLGLLVCPLQLYTIWLLIRIFFSNEPLRPDKRRKAWLAAAIIVPYVVVLLVELRMLLRGE